MSDSALRVHPNTGDVAAKVIDGEAIIMNLANGLYYSMDEVGSAIWEMVEQSRSVAEMAGTLEARYDVERATVEADVQRLVGELLDEGLVVTTEEIPDAPAAHEPAGSAAYAAPTLNRYDDMADLLALDPPMPGLGTVPAE